MRLLIQNYKGVCFNENAEYCDIFQDNIIVVTINEGEALDDAVLSKVRVLCEDELAYLSYDVLDCGVKTDDKEWYKIKVRYVAEDEFWYADRRRRRFLYSD